METLHRISLYAHKFCQATLAMVIAEAQGLTPRSMSKSVNWSMSA